MGPLLHEGLGHAARRFGGRDFIRAGDRHWSFTDLDRMSTAFAHHLAGRGVSRGDRVAVMATNRVELVAAVHGISMVGAAAIERSCGFPRVPPRDRHQRR